MPVTPFIAGERDRAARWKRTCPDLPEGARADADYFTGRGVIEGPFSFCLPAEFSTYNLLPSAQHALDLFKTLGIPWHAGVDGGPSNHLLDSQVQCVNALAPYVHDPAAVAAIFGQTLDIAEVVEIEDGRYLTFEWIGEADYLGEREGLTRTRGSRTTSADAAIRYRTPSGVIEVALIEWKYTEDYAGKELSGGVEGLELRMQRYRPLWDDPACPIEASRVAYGDLFREPLYQLLRLQLLANQMEQSHELKAERVRLVIAASSRNRALAGDFRRWPRLLRYPDRFQVYDTDQLFTSSATTDEFRSRYGS